MKTSRAVFSEVQKKAGHFPFTLRALDDETRARMGVTEAVAHGESLSSALRLCWRDHARMPSQATDGIHGSSYSFWAWRVVTLLLDVADTEATP